MQDCRQYSSRPAGPAAGSRWAGCRAGHWTQQAEPTAAAGSRRGTFSRGQYLSACDTVRCAQAVNRFGTRRPADCQPATGGRVKLSVGMLFIVFCHAMTLHIIAECSGVWARDRLLHGTSAQQTCVHVILWRAVTCADCRDCRPARLQHRPRVLRAKTGLVVRVRSMRLSTT